MGTYTGTPHDWATSEEVTAAKLNKGRDFFRAFTDAWTSFTPTLTAATTNPTGWTQTGYYARAGKLAHVKGILTAGGSMTPGSGVYRIALPADANTSITDCVLAGSAFLVDASTGNVLSHAVIYSNAAGYVCLKYGTGGAGSIVAHDVPWTWAAGDTIQFAFSYEAA